MPEFNVNHGGVLKSAKEFFVNHGGVLKSVKEAYVNHNGVLKKFWPIVEWLLPLQMYCVIQGGGQPYLGYAGMVVNSNGTINDGAWGLKLGNYVPTETGIGSDYEVKFTQVDAGNGIFRNDVAWDTWHSLSSSKSVTVDFDSSNPIGTQWTMTFRRVGTTEEKAVTCRVDP